MLKSSRKVFSVFDGKIRNLIERYTDLVSKFEENIEIEHVSVLWDGILAKIQHILRKEIGEITNTRLFRRTRERKRKKDQPTPRSTDAPIQLRAATKFASTICLIHELMEQRGEEQWNLNLIANLKEKVHCTLRGND